MKGLTLSVYRDTDMGDCSNGGVSARFRRVTLVGPGVPGVSEPTDDAPAVVYDPRHYDAASSSYSEGGYCPPVGRPLELGTSRGMFGGAFAYSSDSRFRDLTPGGGPLPLHDRVE